MMDVINLAHGSFYMVGAYIGLSMLRAGVADKEMVGGLGINVGRLFTGVFMFGAALAAFSGVVAGPILGLYQGMDSETLIIALIVVVVGGMGTLTGAFWGALLIG